MANVTIVNRVPLRKSSIRPKGETEGIYVRQLRLMIPTTFAVICTPFFRSALSESFNILRSRDSTSSSTSASSASTSAFSPLVISPSSTIVSVVPRHSDSGNICIATTSPCTALLIFSRPTIKYGRPSGVGFETVASRKLYGEMVRTPECSVWDWMPAWIRAEEKYYMVRQW